MSSVAEREILSDVLRERIKTGEWKAANIRLLERALSPGRKVCEIGAGLGYCTQVISRLVFPRGVCVSFEPSPVFFPIAERRAENLRRTVVIQAAVGVAPGMAKVEGPPAEPWRCMIVPDDMGSLPMRGLAADVLTEQNHFDALVLDCEGVEHDLLGAVDVAEHGIRDVVCEVHGSDEDVDDLNRHMKSWGWKANVKTRRDPWDNVCVWWTRKGAS